MSCEQLCELTITRFGKQIYLFKLLFMAKRLEKLLEKILRATLRSCARQPSCEIDEERQILHAVAQLRE